MYFEKFPQILYDFEINGDRQVKLITDVTRNIRFRRDVLANVTVFDEYDIVDGETPEIIAEKLYGNPEYHWIIMLANERFDYRSDFPVDQNVLNEVIVSKYNPTLYSVDGDWRLEDDKIWLKVSNAEDALNPNNLITSFGYTIQGRTGEYGAFTISGTSNPWDINDTSSGIDYYTQEFWIVTDVVGTPNGDLTITTTNREYHAVYWLDDNGFKIAPPNLENIWDPNFLVGYNPVTAKDYEIEENEKKRRIKVVPSNIIDVILQNFKDQI